MFISAIVCIAIMAVTWIVMILVEFNRYANLPRDPYELEESGR